MQSSNKNSKPKIFRRLYILALVFLGIVTLSFTWAHSADISELIRVARNTVHLEVNGVRISGDRFVFDRTTYVPVRAVAEMLGKEVGWNALTRVASINEKVNNVDELAKLLPGRAPFKWIYNGFAEYGHTLDLISIVNQDEKRIYNVTGVVDDASGGEFQADFSINLRYVLEGNRLIQEKTETRMMDSTFDTLTLIESPLVAGTYWTESLVDQARIRRDVSGQITKVEVLAGGIRQFTVRHTIRGSEQYEQRVIREGVGVVSFETLFKSGTESFPISYYLFEPNGPAMQNVVLYFADNQAESVVRETRDVTVEGGGVEWAVLQALLGGPRLPGSYATMPSGTRVLSLNVANGICTVNFSREFIDNHPGGSAGEMMTLGSIVNSLTELPYIQQVAILVEGRSGETLGNILLDRPLSRMQDLIGVQ